MVTDLGPNPQQLVLEVNLPVYLLFPLLTDALPLLLGKHLQMEPIFVLFIIGARDRVSLPLDLLVHLLFSPVNLRNSRSIDEEVSRFSATVNCPDASDDEFEETVHLLLVLDHQVNVPRLELQRDALPCEEWKSAFLRKTFGEAVIVLR